jgi:hypothetical protein
MPSEEKLIQLVNQLIRRTVEGKLEWELGSVPSSLNRATDHVIDSYCETEYKGQTLAVFERRIHAYDGDRDSFYWTGNAGLAIIEGGTVLWENEQGFPALWTLLKVAKESASGIENILDSLLE